MRESCHFALLRARFMHGTLEDKKKRKEEQNKKAI